MGRNPVMAGVTAFILITCILFLLEPRASNLLHRVGIKNPPPNLVILVCFAIVSFLFLPTLYIVEMLKEKNRLQQKILDLNHQEETLRSENLELKRQKVELEKEVKILEDNLEGLKVDEKIGLVQAWSNFDAAKLEIRKCILKRDESTRKIDIFIHAESGLIDGSNTIIGYALANLASRNKREQPDQLRILIPSLENPYYIDPNYGLKERGLNLKNINPNNFRMEEEEYIKSYINTRIERFEAKLMKLKNNMIKLKVEGLENIEVREHKQPYLWNLIIVGSKVFVQGDVYKSCINNAPVMLFEDFKLEDKLARTYYYTYIKYFEDVWSHKSQNSKLSLGKH